MQKLMTGGWPEYACFLRYKVPHLLVPEGHLWLEGDNWGNSVDRWVIGTQHGDWWYPGGRKALP